MLARAVELLAAAPGPAERAAAALDRCLAGVRASVWPEVAWRSSRLNPSGFPVELACSSAGDELRYATEVAGPEGDTRDRLALAARLCAELGGAAVDTGRLARLQAAGRLQWGAWLGGRHGAAGDRFKVYAETPRGPEAEAFVAEELGALRLHRRLELLMVGVEPARGRVELYFRSDGLEVGELRWLLGRAGQEEREGELRAILEELGARPPVLDQPGLGFSLSRAAGAAPDRFALFRRAAALGGDDGEVRRRLLALPGHRLHGYRRLTASLDGDRGRGVHGLIGVGVAAGIEVSVGICPATLASRTRGVG